jgi:maleylacetoacetate isomerase/maleylpyruvate isomerase
MKLYTYWRSLATFRVRIALNLKGLSYEPVYVDLDAGDQRQPEFKTINPQMVIPALVEDDGNVLFQSLAILEYLNEIQPQPPLLPADARGRAGLGPDRGRRFPSPDRAAGAQSPGRHAQCR